MSPRWSDAFAQDGDAASRAFGAGEDVLGRFKDLLDDALTSAEERTAERSEKARADHDARFSSFLRGSSSAPPPAPDPVEVPDASVRHCADDGDVIDAELVDDETFEQPADDSSSGIGVGEAQIRRVA